MSGPGGRAPETHPAPARAAAPAGDAAQAAATVAPPPRAFDRRHAALSIIAVLAVVFALQLARDFVIPLVISIVLSYALEPPVSFLHRRLRLPLALAASVVVAALVALIVVGVLSLRGQVWSIVDSLPQTAQKVSRTIEGFTTGNGSILDKLRSATNAVSASEKQPAGGARVVVERPADKLEAMLLAGSMGVAAFLGQGLMVIFLVFFLLLSGDIFKRKFIKICGHTLTEKKISVHMLDEIHRSIRLYMMMMVVTNVLLGLLTWVAFRWIGLDNAGTWAVVAGALHVIPYFGPLLVAVFTGVAAVVQFGEVGPALLVVGVSLMIASLIGFVVQTWMTGRIARMNPVAVFVILLLFTWIWGIWGTLLSIPIAVIVKVVADHVEGFQGVAEFLGE
ncbi:AI-2E family transporter [Bordetella flabilis]|uniref:AI-2E family transporter n=1 Tax=Bordetella flabilis TaxID=463014 RepID=A0A193GKG9_9BORD|nr:AI-2E family transporter [Bordetella flabilis]ANN80597.1 AI-2E family transporter [Bordetella flabilis]